MSDARATYVAGRDARTADLRVAEARARSIGTARVIVALVAVALVIAHEWGPLGGAAWWGFTACVVAFGALVVVHARLAAASDRAAAALRFYVRGLKRIDDQWRDLPNDGARFAEASEAHAYADDLDVFGRASIFQRVDATETRFGEQRLASWLVAASEPIDLEDVRARQGAVRDLAPRVPFRERLSAAASILSLDGVKTDPSPFVRWASGSRPVPNTGLFTALAWALPALFLAGVAGSRLLGWSNFTWIVPLIAELGVLRATSRFVEPLAGLISAREDAFARYGEILGAIEQESFEAPLLRSLREQLRATGADATAEMARLQRALSFLEARNNDVWRIFIGPVLLWDLHCVLALERWRLRAGVRVASWLDVVGTVEALASLAGFAFEEPGLSYPEFGDVPRFVAEGLAHPLLSPRARVANDVTLAGPGHALVITGSNMSGKSTLLRAMGVNAVLALTGAPICAKRLSLGPIRVATSMRVRDSLSEGVSRFYAEVRKLKGVIERAREPSPPATLFLLDEVLHGTNSRERLIGARAIVRELVGKGAIGAVSTHDLALGDLEAELGGKVQNVHFEEQVTGDRMTFDYVLRPGVVKSSNALRIMRMVGIDVVSPE